MTRPTEAQLIFLINDQTTNPACAGQRSGARPAGTEEEFSKMLPETTSRVAEHSDEAANERIRRRTENNIELYRAAGSEFIDRRLAELDREWDIERLLEANAASVVLAGLVLGVTVSRKWLVLPVAVGGFLLQHALQGWCPPLIWFRRMGVRTATEIDLERFSLKVLRGDFADLGIDSGAKTDISEVLDAVER
jgi:hypothetical protein